MDIGIARVITRIMGLIAACLLILGLLLSSINCVAFDLDYYDREYRKLEISKSTGMSQEALLSTTKELLDYIKDKREDLEITALVHGQERLVFNQREIDHMVDVKDLFALAFKLRWISFVIFGGMVAALTWLKGKDSLRDLSISYLIILAILGLLCIILLVLILMDFTMVWNTFHHIFFSNDLWILNPKTDILIQMVPEGFFFDTVTRILKIFGSILSALAIGSGIILFGWVKPREGKA